MKFNPYFADLALSVAIMSLGVSFAGCGRSGENSEGFPDGFRSMSSGGKVEYMMQHVEPDSVARFICEAALGMYPGVGIDLSEATLYAYEHYKGKDFEKFTIAYEDCTESFSLSDKMKLYQLAGTTDPQQFGYTLGLEYISNIRSQSKDVNAIRQELAEFRKVCGTDKDTYRRFVIGFKTALKADHGKDLDEAIYTEFINYEEDI